MRSRRGEVPFVAIRVGRSNDPREVLGLAQELKIPRALALGYVAIWEEMILELGDALTGRLPSGYTAAHVAAKLGFTGKPARLIAALKAAGVLGTHRGVFLHSYWRASITGQYAIEKAQLREEWREKKRQQRAGDVPELSQGHGGDVPPVSSGKTDINQFTESGAPPPQPPARGGGSLGATRWEWLKDHHERPSNSRACIKYLEVMTDEDWALLQWVLTPAEAGGPYKLSRKKRVLGLDTHRFLANEAYLQLRPEWRAKLAHDAKPKRPPTALAAVPREDPKAEAAKRAAAAAAFIVELLADDGLEPAEKEAAKARWVASHPDVPPPWETQQ